MKIIIFIILFIQFINILVFSQQYPIPSTGSKWGIINTGGLYPGWTSGEIQEYAYSDTILPNGKKYIKWNRNGSESEAAHFTRFENNRLYLVDTALYHRDTTIRKDSIYEILMYDFNLNLGDTFYLSDKYIPQFATKLVVTYITYEKMLNGQYRKRMKLINFDYQGFTEKWLEGVGDLLHSVLYLFEPSFGNPEVGAGIVCFEDSSGLIYKTIDFDCDSLPYYHGPGAINQESLKFSFINPNPVRDISILKVPTREIYNLEIFDVFGRKVLQKEIKDDFQIKRSEFKQGMYVFRLWKNGRFCAGGKFVVK